MKVHLPDEIVDHILCLACTLPPLQSDRYREPSCFDANLLKARSSAPHLDIPTTLKLLLLSPQHYPYIASILYKGPRLSDPITLTLFARTLTHRPSLGRLVKHLWVGHTYQGESIPINAHNFGLGGVQNAYALHNDLATLADVRRCLAHGIAPSNLLSPAFEKRIAQWAAQNVQANSRSIDPRRAPRGIHIDSPGSGDPDSRGWHWIGVDEWVLRLWDGRDLVKQFREIAKRAFFLELRRLSQQSTPSSSPTPPTRLDTSSSSTLLNTDLKMPFEPRDVTERRPGTDHDPLDWAETSQIVESNQPTTTNNDQPSYSEDFDLDEIDAERDRCFAQMGVKKPASQCQNWSEPAMVSGHKMEWWVVWLLAKTRARARIVARRVWQAEFQNGFGQPSWRPLRPQPELRTKNHFTHPTLFARSGATHLLVGGAAPPERDELWNHGRQGDFNDIDESDTDAASDGGMTSDGSEYGSGPERTSTHMGISTIFEPTTHSDRPGTAQRKARFSLPQFVEIEQLKSEDQADLWGGEHNFTSGNERAGAGNSVIGSRGGMFGFDSALSKGLLDEKDDGLEDGSDYACLQKQQQRKHNEEDRLLSELTLGSILASLRAVLTLTPQLRNLSLNGVLERAVCGSRPMCSMAKLKSLSLGPPPPYWSSPLLFGQPMKTTRHQRLAYRQARHDVSMSPEAAMDESRSQSMWPLPGILIPSPVFATLRTLHISGCMLFPSEARAVGGLGGQLPSLRHFRWSLWQPHVEGHPVGVVETLCAILDILTPEEEAASGGISTSSPRVSHDADSRKRRRRHDEALRRSNVGTNQNTSADDSTGAMHEANMYALVTRKRKLRSVYATLHATDQAIFARKAPPALRYDPRLKMETAKCQNVEDNLEEMQRWWEWESGQLHFKPTVSNLEAISAAALKRQQETQAPPTSISAQELNADHSDFQFDLERAMDHELELGRS